MPRRWKIRPAGSNWGEFGDDDQWGRLNLITDTKVRQGIAEVREGRTFCLSLPLDLPGGNVLNPRRFAPILRPTQRGTATNANYPLRNDGVDATDVINDDLVILHTHYSTHWDALSHVGQMFDSQGDSDARPTFYNGFLAGTDIVGSSDLEDAGAFANIRSHSTLTANRIGIERMAERCVQGRAVLIDLAAHLGQGRTIVDFDMLQNIMRRDEIKVETGDIVCLHTGFAQILVDGPNPPDPKILGNACAALDGRDPSLLRWISESGIAALAADNVAVEVLPAASQSGCCAALPLHEHCLFKLGVHLGEFWYLTELAAYLRACGRNRFLLTAPPLRLTGAVGSPTTPIATV